MCRNPFTAIDEAYVEFKLSNISVVVLIVRISTHVVKMLSLAFYMLCNHLLL